MATTSPRHEEQISVLSNIEVTGSSRCRTIMKTTKIMMAIDN
ncbi:10823_t:CDS:2 [Funneliformis geosporum]|uniref:10823_t:CDS:1 n=1 Tax=Funneliformis geosporum TaxID=1117311 RepID=A0A9W4SD23_9GLOM|nr:10823_t:CDS:2 [Funneliformis geosporum]